MPTYIIRAGDTEMVKIGWTDDVERRRSDLQCGCWEVLTTIRVIDGPRAVEGWMQRRFANRHVLREWYRLHPDMLTVAVEALEPRAPGLSPERRQQIADAMRKSWQEGNLRRTFEQQQRSQVAAEAA